MTESKGRKKLTKVKEELDRVIGDDNVQVLKEVSGKLDKLEDHNELLNKMLQHISKQSKDNVDIKELLVFISEITEKAYKNDIDTPEPKEVNISKDYEHKQFTVGTSQVEIVFTKKTKKILIQADHDNTGSIWLGKDGLTTETGAPRLKAGESVEISYNDSTNALYAISDTPSQKVNVSSCLNFY
jgi:hypothetical protein